MHLINLDKTETAIYTRNSIVIVVQRVVTNWHLTQNLEVGNYSFALRNYTTNQEPVTFYKAELI